jgi:hypothetical protein
MSATSRHSPPDSRLRPTLLGISLLLGLCSIGVASAASLPLTAARIGTFASAATVPVTTCSVTAAADTYTSQPSSGTSYATATDLRVTSRTGQAMRTFVRFDLTSCSIPAAAVVRTAELRLRMSTAPTATRSYAAYRLDATWAETLTWGGTQPSQAASPTATVATGTTAVTLAWDVQADAQAFVAGAASNHGWVVRDTDEAGTTTRTSVFRSREYGMAALRPTLVLTYHP